MSAPAKLAEDLLVSGDWCVEREDDDGKVEWPSSPGRTREIARFNTPTDDIGSSPNYPSGVGEIRPITLGNVGRARARLIVSYKAVSTCFES